MNALLFEPHEVQGDGTALLAPTDRRAVHLRTVLRVRCAQELCAGVLDGGLGRARVLRDDDRGIALACTFDRPAPRARDTLLLAIPRPKVLRRCVETAAALGFAQILLVRTWRTDKSHVEASALAGAELRHHAILGLEQAQRTRVPAIAVHPLFKPFVEDRLDACCGDAARVLADPDAPRALRALGPLADRPLALAIGPERGFTPYERDLLGTRGFVACHAGAQPLRVETALAFVCGQLAILRADGMAP